MRLPHKSHYSFWVKPLFWLQKRNFGYVLNPARLWGRRPILFWLVAGFFGYLDRQKSPLSPVIRSLVCVRVSQLNDCAFCVDANGMRLAERCDSVEKIQALFSWENSALFSDSERTVLQYVDSMTITGHKVSDDLLQSLRALYDEDTIIELTALIGFQNLSAKFNTALDVPAQGFCQIQIQQHAEYPKQAKKPTPPQEDK